MQSERTMSETFYKINCPACDQHIEIPKELFGEAVTCPNCNLGFVVPKAAVPAKRPKPKWFKGVVIMLGGIALFDVGGLFTKPSYPSNLFFSLGGVVVVGYGLVQLAKALADQSSAKPGDPTTRRGISIINWTVICLGCLVAVLCLISGFSAKLSLHASTEAESGIFYGAGLLLAVAVWAKLFPPVATFICDLFGGVSRWSRRQ